MGETIVIEAMDGGVKVGLVGYRLGGSVAHRADACAACFEGQPA